MTHAYSVEVHDYISEKIAIAEEENEKAQKQDDFEAQRFYQGQLKELFKMREYLTEKIDLKTQKYY
jgi:hypothetical protein